MARNKVVKFAEMALFDNVFQPSYEELRRNGFPLKNNWKGGYFGNQGPLTLELGCGKGEYAVGLASKFHERNFIGVDIKGARMFTGARYAFQNSLKNVAFVRTKIENTPMLFGEGEISEIWLTFPDPQMKNVRKRLTSTWFIDLYRKFLVKDGIIHVKTDSGFQYNYVLASARLNGFRILEKTEDLSRSGLLNDVLGIRTYYEKQWTERGISIKYIAFVPGNESPLEEPENEIEKDNYRSFGRMARNIQI